MGRLDGKVVLVTGGEAIGQSVSLACAREGARIVIDDRGAPGSPARIVCERIVERGGDAVALSDGIFDPAGAERLVSTAMEHWGRLDAVIAEVGPMPGGDFGDDSWRDAVIVPLEAIGHLVEAADEALRGGTLVLVTTDGWSTGTGSQASVVVNHGVAGLVRAAGDAADPGRAYLLALHDHDDVEAAADLSMYLASGAHDAPAELFGVSGPTLRVITVEASRGITRPTGQAWSAEVLLPRLAELRASLDGPLPLTAGLEPTTSSLDDDTLVAPTTARLWPIGKRYDGGYWLVDHEEAQVYAAATDDANPAYTGPGAVTPPMYHVRPFRALLQELARDPELDLDLVELTHREHAMRFRRALRHGDVLQLRGTLESVQQKPSGRVLTFGLYGMVDGEIALEGTTSFAVRGNEPAGESSGMPETPPTWSVVQRVHPDQAVRYAEASGDHDPIHLDGATAAAAGLPRPVLHPLCAMAMAQRDLVVRAAGSDSSRLAFLGCRFAAPVFPGDLLTMDVWDLGDGQVVFATRTAEGEWVLAQGRAELDP